MKKLLTLASLASLGNGYLSTFDPDPKPKTGQQTATDDQAPPATEAPRETPPPVVPPPVDPVRARARLSEVQAQNDQEEQQRARREEPTGDVLKELKRLRESQAELNNRLYAQQMENYRLQAIQSAREAGHDLIDALVTGRNPQEIDAAVQVAVAEHALLRSKWEKQQAVNRPAQQQQEEVPQQRQQTQRRQPAQQQRRAQQPPVQQQDNGQEEQLDETDDGVPRGYAADVAQPHPDQARAQQGNQQAYVLSVPSYINPGQSANQQPQGLTAEDLAYLTSQEAIANGDYAKNRHMIHAALRSSAPGPGGRAWTFNNTQQIAPSMPMRGPQRAEQIVQQQAQQQPAMQRNVFAGVTQPQTRAPGPSGAMQNGRQAPQRQGFGPDFTPQPGDIDNGVPLDTAAAQRGAQAALAKQRASAGQPLTGPITTARNDQGMH